MLSGKKCAWYSRDVSIALPLVVSTTVALVLYLLVGPMAATITFYVLLFGLMLVLAKRQDAAAVATDERVRMLRDKASLAGALTFLFVFMSACMILLVVCEIQAKETITVRVTDLSMIAVAGVFLFCVIRTVAYFILLRRESCHGED